MNQIGDVVLILYQEKPAVYARVEAVQPDIKKDWYQVTLLLLTVPSQVVTWILRQEYIQGAPFTMGGQAMRLEEIKRVVPQADLDTEGQGAGEKGPEKGPKVVPLRRQP